MKNETRGKDSLLSLIRSGSPMSLSEQWRLVCLLSWPAIMAQISATLMQYIDAAMVGHLGAQASASIGIIETTMWMMGGLCSAVATGFTVQVAHRIGAADFEGARSVVRQSLVAVGAWGLFVAFIGAVISSRLPLWLGAQADVAPQSSRYFLIFSLCLPFLQMEILAGGMLRSSGNMLVPSVLNVAMAAMDVVFNFFLIYPSRSWRGIFLPGAGLGVEGAALGTALAEMVTVVLMLYFLLWRSHELSLRGTHGRFLPQRRTLMRALHIGVPMGVQHVCMCSAQIVSTLIIAPLGTAAIAAHSLGIAVEALCYMPGYGVADAATTLVGQSVGAGRSRLARRFAMICVAGGMVVMGAMGIVMWLGAPTMMAMLSPDVIVQHLGVSALRIEAWAEPMFAAGIVCYGAFVGAGDTLRPALMNLGSMWGVRISLMALLAARWGLNGVWTAMCVELCFRGTIFLVRLLRGRWLPQPADR